MSYRFILLLATWLSCNSVTVLTSLSERAVAMGTQTAQSEASQKLVYDDVLPLAMGDRPSSTVAVPPSDTKIAQTSPSPELLKVGSRGARVRELQALLQQMGYDVTPDGNFGEKTRLAVVDFQLKRGLPADGQVGQETFDLLEQGFTDTLTDLTGIPTGSPTPGPEPAGAAEPSPAVSSTPSVEAMTGETLTPSAPSSTATAQPSPTEPPFNMRWVGLGLGVLLIFAALLGAIAYTLGRGGKLGPLSPRSIKLPDRQWATSPAPPQGLLEPSSDPAVPTPPEVTTNGEMRNGTTPAANGYAKSAPASFSYTAIPSNEIPRLQKVDIGEELIKDLQSPDPNRRRKAIWDLGQHGDSRAVQPLVELMIDSDSSQRNLILAALSEIGMRTMKPMNRALMISLEDENSDVRKNAIRDVTRVYEQFAQLTTILRHAIDDRDLDVQQTAHWALNQINRIRALPETDSAPGLGDSSSHSADSVRQDSSTSQ